MGRDVGRDEGREQAEWRDLVARLELGSSVDPAQAPWPDRENLAGKTAQGAAQDVPVNARDGSAQDGSATDVSAMDADGQTGDIDSQDASPEDAHGAGKDEAGRDGRRPADRSRVIRPAGAAKFSEPADEPPIQAVPPDPDDMALGGPRDYTLDQPGDNDLGEWDERYIPPAVPRAPKLDPVAKGAWLALFGGPGYLLVATLLNWQIAGWAALAAVIAFVAGFVVLVFRLGDGPSKRDGPDQGAVV